MGTTLKPQRHRGTEKDNTSFRVSSVVDFLLYLFVSIFLTKSFFENQKKAKA